MNGLQYPHGFISYVRRYGGAVVLVLAAILARQLLLRELGSSYAYITFYPAVLFSALLGGVGPGLLATCLAEASASFYFVEPSSLPFSTRPPAEQPAAWVFVVSSVFISGLCEAFYRRRSGSGGCLAVPLPSGRSEEALREFEDRYRTLFETLIEGFCIIDVIFDDSNRPVDYRFLVTNPTFEAQTGLHAAEGKLMRELVANHEEHWFETYGRIAVTGRPERFVSEARALNRWYDVHAYKVGGEDSRKVAILFNDITERKLTEDNQAILTEVLRILNKGGNLHTLVSDTLRFIREATGFDAVGLRLREDGDCPYFEQNGFSDEFLIEENFLCRRDGSGNVLLNAEGKPLLECTCGLVLSGCTPAMPCFTDEGGFWTNSSTDLLALPRNEDPRTNPRNRCIHVGYQSVGLFPLRVGGEILGLLQLNDRRAGRFTPALLAFYESLAQNIGLAIQRITAEDALARAKREADRANQAKDEFLAVLSHELRTPLTPVLAAVHLMQRQGGISGEAQRHLEIIRRNVQLEARLIDDLLDLTRIVSGKILLEQKSLDIGTVISRVIEICKPDIDGRKLYFNVEHGRDPLLVSGDASRLQQVVWNLLNNSIKFTPDGGWIKISSFSESGKVFIQVADSGLGLEPAAKSRIFNAFEQVDRAITRQFGGLGLGLAISKRIVEMHGGSISVDSPGKGKGTTFTVILPAITASEEFEVHEEEIPLGVEKVPRRILLVEDHADTALMMQALLESAGYQVRTAGGAQEALAAIASERFDLLISDLGLPGQSGFQLMEELRRRGSLLKAIALSGYGREDDVKRSQYAGFSKHLTKPVDVDTLMATVDRMLLGSAA